MVYLLNLHTQMKASNLSKQDTYLDKLSCYNISSLSLVLDTDAVIKLCNVLLHKI